MKVKPEKVSSVEDVDTVRPAGNECPSAGEKIGMDVNSWSNWDVSSDPTKAGCHGAGRWPSNSRSKSISVKKTWP